MVVTERVFGEEDDRGRVAAGLTLTSFSREWMTRMLGVIRQIGFAVGTANLIGLWPPFFAYTLRLCYR